MGFISIICRKLLKYGKTTWDPKESKYSEQAEYIFHVK